MNLLAGMENGDDNEESDEDDKVFITVIKFLITDCINSCT